MRKCIFILFVCVCLMLTMVSCTEEYEGESDFNTDITRNTLSSTTEKSSENMDGDDGFKGIILNKEYYLTYDIDDFVEDYWQSQGKDTNVLNFKNENPDEIKMPYLCSKEHTLYFMEANEYNFIYNYVQIGYSQNFFDPLLGIIVYVSREDNSFEGHTKDLPTINGQIVDIQANSLYLNNNGKALSIVFPKSIPVKNVNLDDYFTFVSLRDF